MVTVMLINTSCKFMADFFEDGNKSTETEEKNVKVNSLKLNKTLVSIKIGELSYIGYTISSNDSSYKPTWTYDNSIIKVSEEQNGVVITGLKEGQTSLTATAKDKSATAIITVSGYAENYESQIDPYIYSSTSIVQMAPNESKKISVSLFNGTGADISDYTWTIDNMSTASIQPTGQYAVIQAQNEGYARIKITHPKATYPYYIGVYVFADISKTPYITTTDNILSLNKADGEKTISVDMENPAIKDYISTFKWSLLEGSERIDIIYNKEKCVITPKSSGIATVRVSNPDAGAVYPLDIIIRVIEVVENVYVVPSSTIVNIHGSDTQVITSTLEGFNNPDTYYSEDEFTYEFSENGIVDFYSYGNKISVTGIANGTTSLYIGHPFAEKKRQVLVIVDGQTTNAIDSSCYITTSQNYIKAKVGDPEIKLNVMLNGGDESDASNYKWSVTQNPEDGTSNVIKLDTTYGTSTSAVSGSRAASQTIHEAYALIEPKAPGTATISVTNSKCYYPTEILVKVIEPQQEYETPYFFDGCGLVSFLNSESYTYTVNLSGAAISEYSDIKFECENPNLEIIANDKVALLTSKTTGTNVFELFISHPKAQNIKRILVITADTSEELERVQALYSDKTYYAVNVGKTITTVTKPYGYVNEEGESLDFTTVADKVSWRSSNPSVATVEKDEYSPLWGNVTGIKTGTCTIYCTYEGKSCSFNITVYPEAVDVDDVDPYGNKEDTIKYLTTQNNVINIYKVNDTADVLITGVGLAASDLLNLEWNIEDENIASVISNGSSAIVTGLSEGETKLFVTHPESENKLTLYVRVGSEYVMTTEPVKYISTNTDIIVLKKDSSIFTLNSYLVNGEQNEGNSGWAFNSEYTGIAEIVSQMDSGKCFIKAGNAGQSEITITHPSAEYEKKVLVVVGNTDEELAKFKYLSTTSNVITIAEGQTKKVSVTMENSPEVILTGYSWESDDNSIAKVNSFSGANAIIQGNEIGTTKIVVILLK